MHVARRLIEMEINNGPPSQYGYRSMHQHLRSKFHLAFPRDTVMNLLKEVDPVGTSERRQRRLRRRKYVSPGPNHTWHIDGYDKLKPYGFPIHGCVDGFSRRIIWLNVARSNKNPVIPAAYYLEALKNLKKCPKSVVTDLGTENGIIASFQCYLQQDPEAHRYVKSVNNQRIENLWSHFRRCYNDWVINFFKDMVEEGVFSIGNHLHMECMWFVFHDFLQDELNNFRQRWNTHSIRRSSTSVIGGVPDQLYFLPQSVGYSDCGKDIPDNDIHYLHSQLDLTAAREAECEADQDFITYLKYVVANNGLTHPVRSWSDGKYLFKFLISTALSS